MAAPAMPAAAVESASTVEPAAAMEAAVAAVEAAFAMEVTAAVEPFAAVKRVAAMKVMSTSEPVMVAIEAAPVKAGVTPSVEPRTRADERAAYEVIRAVVTIRGACIRIVAVIPIRAGGRRPDVLGRNTNPHSYRPHSNPDPDLRMGCASTHASQNCENCKHYCVLCVSHIEASSIIARSNSASLFRAAYQSDAMNNATAMPIWAKRGCRLSSLQSIYCSAHKVLL